MPIAPPVEVPTPEAAAAKADKLEDPGSDLPNDTPDRKDSAAPMDNEASEPPTQKIPESNAAEVDHTGNNNNFATNLPPTVGSAAAKVGQWLNTTGERWMDHTERLQRETLAQTPLSEEMTERLIALMNVNRDIGPKIRTMLGIEDQGIVWEAAGQIADSVIPWPVQTVYGKMRQRLLRTAEQTAKLQQLREGKQLETEDTQN